MPNSLQSSAIASPASRRATNCILSSVTEHSFQGISPSLKPGGSVTYVSGTKCHLCLRSLIQSFTLQFPLLCLAGFSGHSGQLRSGELGSTGRCLTCKKCVADCERTGQSVQKNNAGGTPVPVITG